MSPLVYKQPQRERNAPRRTSAVLFDLDDTLFDQARAVRGGLEAIAARFEPLARQPLDKVRERHDTLLNRLHEGVLRGIMSIDEARRIRLGRLLVDAGLQPTEADLDIAVTAYRTGYVDAWCAIAGARPLLERLRREARIAIVTNNKRDEQLAKLRACGLEDLIDALVVYEDARVAKPDPEMFQISLKRLGATADEAVVVGDSWSSDVLGAAAAGIRAVWFNRQGVTSPDATLATEIPALEPTEPVARVILGSSPS
jgi:HAD superfamily hydrolase (TIGR01509 family)